MALATQLKSKKKLTPDEVRESIEAVCKESNYDPFKELIALATETVELQTVGGGSKVIHVATPDQRITIAKEIAGFLAPKLKSVEVKQEISGEINITVRKFTDAEPIDTTGRITTEVPQKLLTGQE